MLEQYFPILLFIFVGLAVGVALPLAGGTLSRLLGVHRPDPEKLSPYECGFEAFEDARMKFDVRYYLVAILFILFDLEIVPLSLGGGAPRNRYVRFPGNGPFPRNPRGRLRLRVEKRGAGMGVRT